MKQLIRINAHNAIPQNIKTLGHFRQQSGQHKQHLQQIQLNL